ncbi:MAG TPA: HipA domain-containing protein [Candidatus Acidoferrales bacterium]|nr:HipA domain-containing protein [Candidatus Acidoferrales bacterium]
MIFTQEDFCQATGTPSGLKYESDGGPGIQKIMDLLLGSEQTAQDRRDFMHTQLVFWLLAAIDGHAKNFSVFLLAGGAYRLTPRYDILSAHPTLGHGRGKLSPQKIKMAMAVPGKRRRAHRGRVRSSISHLPIILPNLHHFRIIISIFVS